MPASQYEVEGQSVCNLKYLSDTMRSRGSLIKEIMEVFIKQIPEELRSINGAIENEDYPTIRIFAHTMKSSVSIMGISILAPVLQEIESLGAMAKGIEKIKVLNQRLNIVCRQAIEEIKSEKHNYV